MTELKELLSELVRQQTPAKPPPLEVVLAKTRSEQRRIGYYVAAVAAVVALGVMTLTLLPGGGAVDDGDSRPANTVASCVEPYSVDAVEGRAFAFDGTVLAVAPREGAGALPQSQVTFEVNEWFHGGDSERFTVLTVPVASYDTADGIPADPGVRLLVSGEWTQLQGSNVATAWGCGFTQSYDVSVAAEWRD